MLNYDFERIVVEGYFAGVEEVDNSDDCYYDTMCYNYVEE